MTSFRTHPSIILLINNDSGVDQSSVRTWFEHSRFNTIEATTIFHAFALISDFTDRSRPDVVLLPVDSPVSEFECYLRLTEGSPEDREHRICALTDDGKLINSDQCFEGNLNQLSDLLDGIIPKDMSIPA